MPENTPFEEPLRTLMDSACVRLTQAQRQMSDLCNEFEALLNAPNRNLGAIQKAHTEVRAAGMREMGLITDYLKTLSDYMKTVKPST